MSTPTRYSQWQTTLPFALNNDFYSHTLESESFITGLTTVSPVLVEFKSIGSDPSGFRHLNTHSSYVGVLASGVGKASLDYKALDLQSTDISTGSGVSKTKVFLFRIAGFSNPNITRVHNMKVWASDTTDFLTPETNKILYISSSPWLSGFAFTRDQIGDKSLWMPTSLPEFQNVFRTDGARTIHGSGDLDVSQWVYCALAASGTTPLGEYGSNFIPSGFNIRVTYQFDNIFSLFD